MEEYKKMWRNFAVFSGRSTRKDYWMAVLFNFVITLLIGIISRAIDFNYLGTIYSVLTIIPSLALVWRRLHDTNRSGLCYFLGLIPIVGWIIVLVFLCQVSVDENNEYGNIVE